MLVYPTHSHVLTLVLGKSELEEFDLVRLLEHRGTTKGSTELRKQVTNMLDKTTHRLSFIELCCHVFSKPYRRFLFADDSSRDLVCNEATAEANKPEAAKIRFAILQEVEEEAIHRRKAEEEVKECSDEGVANKAAFFKKKMVMDEKKAIEMKVREEAAIRKALKKAKEQEEEATKMALQRQLEEEALEQERIERGVVEEAEPEVEEEVEPVEEEEPEAEVAEEPENLAPEVAKKAKRPISMKGFKKRVLSVCHTVNDRVLMPIGHTVNDRVITPFKNKYLKTERIQEGVIFNLPLSEEVADEHDV
jgi:hypothetical protein